MTIHESKKADSTSFLYWTDPRDDFMVSELEFDGFTDTLSVLSAMAGI